jgi:hypothetical protein
MLLEPRMVGCALHGEIERDFHLVLFAGGDEITEILQRAKFRVHRIVTALARTDRIGTSGIAFRRSHGVVAALAVGAADGVDRRQIDDVKAHSRNVRQACDTILERAVLAGRFRLATGHHLIPCAIPRPRPVGH